MNEWSGEMAKPPGFGTVLLTSPYSRMTYLLVDSTESIVVMPWFLLKVLRPHSFIFPGNGNTLVIIPIFILLKL
jgi:hypothetical protein